MVPSSHASHDETTKSLNEAVSLRLRGCVARRRLAILRLLILTTLVLLVVVAVVSTLLGQVDHGLAILGGGGDVVAHSDSSTAPPTTVGRLLYIVTAFAEYDSGRRQTTKGWDRFGGITLPVLRESVESILATGLFCHVDVYVVAHYDVTADNGKVDRIREVLPESVGLQVWSDATPLGYALEEEERTGGNKARTQQRVRPVTRGLARQHRYVVKDKLPYYDVFCIFEDDMFVTGDAVRNYLEVTDELDRLRRLAPATHSKQHHVLERERDDAVSDVFYGIMTKDQLKRMIPGFIRVEVLLNGREEDGKWSELLDPVPIADRPEVDPSCCRWKNALTASDIRPAAPTSEQLLLWETGIRALGIRKLPLRSNIDWVVLQRGPRVSEPRSIIGDYWSGRDHHYGAAVLERPDTKDFDYINNQGGWMATRQQIWEWHAGTCAGGLLPPYDSPHFQYDGLDTRNVEYWSGGMNLVTSQNGCNLQRVIALDPSRFSKSLLYHTSNNKQRQFGSGQWRKKLVKVNDLLGQLNTVKKNAQAEMSRRVAAMNHDSTERGKAQR
jgi:hypothetical protein